MAPALEWPLVASWASPKGECLYPGQPGPAQCRQPAAVGGSAARHVLLCVHAGHNSRGNVRATRGGRSQRRRGVWALLVTAGGQDGLDDEEMQRCPRRRDQKAREVGGRIWFGLDERRETRDQRPEIRDQTKSREIMIGGSSPKLDWVLVLGLE